MEAFCPGGLLGTGQWVFREIFTSLREKDYKLDMRLYNGRDRVLSAERFLLVDSQLCTMTKINNNNFIDFIFDMKIFSTKTMTNEKSKIKVK